MSEYFCGELLVDDEDFYHQSKFIAIVHLFYEESEPFVGHYIDRDSAKDEWLGNFAVLRRDDGKAVNCAFIRVLHDLLHQFSGQPFHHVGHGTVEGAAELVKHVGHYLRG